PDATPVPQPRSLHYALPICCHDRMIGQGPRTVNLEESAMKRSTDRILTTHCGSLPRPKDLLDMMKAKVSGQPFDQDAYARRVRPDRKSTRLNSSHQISSYAV